MIISIRNFMGIESLDLDLTKPLNVFSGQNEAGKSSIRDAVLWGFTGQARSLKTHADQAALIREGAKAAEVHITPTDGKTFTRRKTPKSNAVVTGEIPDIGLSPAILFDPYTFLFLPEAQRRELLFQVIPGLNPTVGDICARLDQDERFKAFKSDETNPQGASLLAIVKIAAAQGFPAAEKEAITRRREVKRVKETLDAKEPGKSLFVDGDEYDIPTLNFAAVEATLKDLSGQKDALMRQKGAGEARGRRITQIKTQLERIEGMNPPAPGEVENLKQQLDKLQADMADNARELEQANVQQQFYPATCPAITLAQVPCPNSGKGVGQEPPLPAVLEALKQNRIGLKQKVEEALTALGNASSRAKEYQTAMGRKAALEEELEKLEAEPEYGEDLDTQIQIVERRILRGHVFQEAIKKYDSDLDICQRAQMKIEACDREIELYDALAKALAPDGIPSQMIAEALDKINGHLLAAATYMFPDRDLRLTPELNIVLSDSPFATLSKSAKFRVGVAFQYALARLAGARLLMIDEVDILDGIHQTEFYNFILAHLAEFDQVMVFFTGDFAAPVCQDARTQDWWLEDGKLSMTKQAESRGEDFGPNGDATTPGFFKDPKKITFADSQVPEDI